LQGIFRRMRSRVALDDPASIVRVFAEARS
jgi:hypothetical protein